MPVWDAFWELATTRPVHMGGAGPIPWGEIDRWCSAQDIQDRRRFTALMRAMDNTYLETIREGRDGDQDAKARD